MPQPTKDRPTINKGPRSKTVKKKRVLTKSEIIKKAIARSKKPHPKYGTSKAEERFAKEILDKLGVEYERQFEAKDIKRFYDFKIGNKILLEFDGCYWHGKGLVHEEKNPMQKRSEYADNVKNEWARAHGYTLIRIWEDDFNEHPTKVLNELREFLDIDKKKSNKNKRH